MATKVDNRTIAKIVALATEGKSDEEISKAIGICRKTLFNWRKNNPYLLHALKGAKVIADDIVEASLYHRACGYSHKAVKMFYDKDTGKVVKEEYIEHYPPDTTACIFWLKNRRKAEWRDTQDGNTVPEASNHQTILDEFKKVINDPKNERKA